MKRILLVDDEYAIVDLLAQLLEGEGFTVLTASNGQDALERAKGKAPDLIITDHMMPLMGGTELYRALKKDAALRQVPVILMTSGPMPTSRGLSWAAYLPKPFEFEEFLRAVRGVLRRAGR